jgi:hypothetical protein
MSNQTVTLLLAAKTEKGWRLPVAFGRNGKIRPQYALVDGVPVHFPGSYYALGHFEGSKTVWTTVGENATDALASRDQEQHLRQARKLAVKAGVTVVEKDEVSHTLLSIKKRWLQKLEARGKRRAIETMTMAIDDFLAVTGHTYSDQITEDSMLALFTALRNRGNSDRTIYVELRICRSKTGKHPSKVLCRRRITICNAKTGSNRSPAQKPAPLPLVAWCSLDSPRLCRSRISFDVIPIFS